METKKQLRNEEDFVQVSIRKIEHKKLTNYKVHPNQAYWEVIKNLIVEKENRK